MEIRNINGVFVAFNESGKEIARSKNKYYLKQKLQGYEDAPKVIPTLKVKFSSSVILVIIILIQVLLLIKTQRKLVVLFVKNLPFLNSIRIKK